MSTLAYSDSDLRADGARAASRQGFWRRAFDRMVAAQQRRADRDIAHYLARHGGLLNDDMEREIMERLSGGSRRSV